MKIKKLLIYQLPYISQDIQIWGVQINLISICWVPIMYKGTVVDIQGNTESKFPDKRRGCIQNTIKDGKILRERFKMLCDEIMSRVTK